MENDFVPCDGYLFFDFLGTHFQVIRKHVSIILSSKPEEAGLSDDHNLARTKKHVSFQ